MYTPNLFDNAVPMFFLAIICYVVMMIVTSPQLLLQQTKQNLWNMLSKEKNSQFKLSEKQNQVFDESGPFEPLAPPGFLRIPMEIDGNCFFRAIAESIYENREDHMVIRNEIVQALFENDLYRYEFSSVPLEPPKKEQEMKQEYYWGKLQMLQMQDRELVAEYLKQVEERISGPATLEDFKVSEVEEMVSSSMTDGDIYDELADFRWDFLKNRLSKDGEWADNYCISTATELLQKNIHIYDHARRNNLESQNWIEHNVNIEGAGTIFLEYINVSHYNLLEKI